MTHTSIKTSSLMRIACWLPLIIATGCISGAAGTLGAENHLEAAPPRAVRPVVFRTFEPGRSVYSEITQQGIAFPFTVVAGNLDARFTFAATETAPATRTPIEFIVYQSYSRYREGFAYQFVASQIARSGGQSRTTGVDARLDFLPQQAGTYVLVARVASESEGAPPSVRANISFSLSQRIAEDSDAGPSDGGVADAGSAPGGASQPTCPAGYALRYGGYHFSCELMVPPRYVAVDNGVCPAGYRNAYSGYQSTCELDVPPATVPAQNQSSCPTGYVLGYSGYSFVCDRIAPPSTLAPTYGIGTSTGG